MRFSSSKGEFDSPIEYLRSREVGHPVSFIISKSQVQVLPPLQFIKKNNMDTKNTDKEIKDEKVVLDEVKKEKLDEYLDSKKDTKLKGHLNS